MPIVPTYPGVYVEEIPSGVRTISGVSTSVTAFVGAARRGPINRAVRILGFADFERNFGGLVSDFELGYAVRQFFQNGGGEAWVIRLARNPVAASTELRSATNVPVLRLTALDEGAAGNEIQVRVDHATATPGSTFNLTLQYVSANPTENRSEGFWLTAPSPQGVEPPVRRAPPTPGPRAASREALPNPARFSAERPHIREPGGRCDGSGGSRCAALP